MGLGFVWMIEAWLKRLSFDKRKRQEVELKFILGF